MIRDITVRVKAQEALREAKNEAEVRAEDLAAVNRVATIVNRSLDLTEILQSICVEFTKIFPVSSTGIALLNNDMTGLVVHAFHTVSPDEEGSLGMILPLDGNLASQEVLDNQKTVVIQDAQTDPRTVPIHELSKARGSKSYLIVPLLARGKAIGTIGMPAQDPGYIFTQNEIELAETIASQIAAAVENARLFGQTEIARDVAERDLEIGRQIQSGFFPDKMPQIPGWEIVTHFHAARQVAGDFYDVFQFRNSPFTAFIIADVCDKGVGAALFMVLFRSLIRAFSEVKIDRQNVPVRLKEIVLNTNNFIAEFHGQSNMFATIFFGILDPESGQFCYINGGHEPPVVMDQVGRIVQRLMPTGPAVGMFPDMGFQVKQIHFDQGDFLVGFTDGATDAKNVKGELYSEERLLDSLKGTWTSIFSMVYNLHVGLQNYIGGQDQFDDITLISFGRKPARAVDCHSINRKAELSNLAEMRDFAAEAARHCGLSNDDAFAFKLAAEEILANIIQYGYEDTEPGLIGMSFKYQGDQAALTITDDGVCFPLDNVETPDIEAGWEERQIGGLGIHFVKELMDRVSYNSDQQKNILVIEKTISTNGFEEN